MQDIITLRNKAKLSKEQGDYLSAVALYEQIYVPECDKWVAWEYATVLKKLARLDDAINVSKSLFQRDSSFLYNNNLLTWLLFEKYFKELKNEYSQREAKQLYQIALYVTKISQQNNTSAYEIIVIKTLKILKELTKPPYDKILVLIDKLDVDKLSDASGEYEKDGQKKEYQSPREMYYVLKTKALLETKELVDCISCCDEALKNIEHFHHDNNMWILSRKAICFAYLGDLCTAIELQREVVIKKNHWSLYDELARMYLKNNENKNALLYYCRAALTSDPPKMKVGLYYNISTFLLENGDDEGAWKHLVFTKNIREKENWGIPYSLSHLLTELSVKNFQPNVSYFELKSFWRKNICEVLGEKYGTVSRINTGGRTGFIQSGNNLYFFKISSFMQKVQLKQNLKVSFVIVESFDIKKARKTVECSYIDIDSTRGK